MKKIIVSLVLIVAVHFSNAQVTGLTLQASGLTCSMCSNAINKSLKTLPFVSAITADIKTSTFTIDLKAGEPVDFDAVKKKVEDAGFFVAKMSATIAFENTDVENDSHIKSGGFTFHFLNVKQQKLNGEQKIRILDKGFVSAKEYKKNKAFTKMKCYETGKAGSCCSMDGIKEGERIFHVTL